MKANLTVPVIHADEAFQIFDASVKWWLEPLDLHTWMVDLHRTTDGKDGWAGCDADPEYKKARLTVWPEYFAREAFTPLRIESTAVHELVHAIIWPGYNEVANPQIPEKVRSYFEEIAADQIAHALMMTKYKNAPEVRSLWRWYRVLGSS